MGRRKATPDPDPAATTAAPAPAAPKETVRLAPPSPRNGNQLPVGKHAGATGGKKGRSGRKRDEVRRALEQLRDTAALPYIERVIAGSVEYTLMGVCEHCGKESKGERPGVEDVLRMVPSPDTRLRASEATLKYTIGVVKSIRLEGLYGAQQAFHAIKTVIASRLPADESESLLRAIEEELQRLRL